MSITSLFAQKDFKGAADHPLIERYTGSYIHSYGTSNYEAYPLMMDYYAEKREMVEGEFTSIIYHAPAGRSQLEVHRNYEKALEAQGFEKVVRHTQCGIHRYLPLYKYSFLPDEHYRELGVFDSGLYTVYKKAGTHVIVMSATNYNQIAVTAIDIVENKEMEGGMVKVNADAIKKALDHEGKISIYGITFATGSASIKPESATTLSEIARFLKANPTIQLYIVGHTDDTGSLSNNLTLSQQRAKAVVNVLVNEYQIATARLTSAGVGPYAPVASNLTDKGKAKNRRVELVRRIN